MKSLIPWKSKQNSSGLWGNDWFDSFWENPFKRLMSNYSQEYSLPATDVSENKNEVVVRAEIPGVNGKDIDLTYQNGILRISGEKKESREQKGENQYCNECRYGFFSKEIFFGDQIEWSKAKAVYKNGILIVKIPKSEKVSRTIEIKIN